MENVVKRKLTDEECYKKYGVKKSDVGGGRKYRIKRSIIDTKTNKVEDVLVELNPEFKNKHMKSLANPFKDFIVTDSAKKIVTRKTSVVLIDPCETCCLLDMSEGGHSINDMLLGKDADLPQLKISNNFMKRRKSPHKDIKIIPLKWR
jgi:hypothetical protein